MEMESLRIVVWFWSMFRLLGCLPWVPWIRFVLWYDATLFWCPPLFTPRLRPAPLTSHRSSRHFVPLRHDVGPG